MQPAGIGVLDLVGKRALLRVKRARYGSDEVEEYRVLEASPSGNWLRVMDANGRKFWKVVSEVAFVEELRDIRAERPE